MTLALPEIAHSLTALAVLTVNIEDLKTITHLLTDNLKVRDASASRNSRNSITNINLDTTDAKLNMYCLVCVL